jgi:hypothetical protein
MSLRNAMIQNLRAPHNKAINSVANTLSVHAALMQNTLKTNKLKGTRSHLFSN